VGVRVYLTVAIGAVAVLGLTGLGLATWDGIASTAPAPDPVTPHDVRILRDNYGVPHIFGKTDADVAYGLAYAHAEDDLLHIEDTLAAVRGRNGAMNGADGAKIDFVSALLDARAVADRGYEAQLSPETRALVEAYAAGLNHYVELHPSEPRLRNLFPVTGHDIVAGFALRSPFFFGLDSTLAALGEDKLPPRDAGPANERGSNALAVAGSHAPDGVTRLISNSHQPWTSAESWYEVSVHSEQGWDFAGALFPGAPFPLLGHNKNLGWTNTVNRPDLIDVYKLTLDADQTHYLYDGKWLPLEAHRIWLRVKFGPFVLPIPKTVYRSVQGPVFMNKLGAFAIRYAGFGDVRQVEEYYKLNKAQDFAAWRGVMDMGAVPATNFVYADAKGDIAYLYNAHFPHRAPGFDYKGVLPGDTSRDVWTTYEPNSAEPQYINPSTGYLFNANNTPFLATGAAANLKAAAFSPLLGVETYMTNRAQRLSEMFTEATAHDPKISRDALLTIKFDKAYSKAAWAGPWIATLLAVPTSDAPDLAKAQALIRQWDWKLDGANPADTLVALVLRNASRPAYRGDPMPDPKATLADAVALLMKYYGRLDPPLGDAMRIQHGPADVAVLGGPDAVRAIYWDVDKAKASGKLVGNNGDGFVMLMEWGKDGQVHSQSIMPFGNATSRPDSKHYADQSALFAKQQFKPVWMTEADVRAHLEREYRP
jgi:acyl-homoserine-lactone acylase